VTYVPGTVCDVVKKRCHYMCTGYSMQCGQERVPPCPEQRGRDVRGKVGAQCAQEFDVVAARHSTRAGAQGSAFRLQGAWLRIRGSECRVQSSRFRA
jgi:hypothetical protein